MHTGPSVIPTAPDHLYLLPDPTASKTLVLATSSPLTTYRLDPSPFFDAQATGLALIGNETQNGSSKVFPCQISRFVRTADGEGLGILREDGTVEIWQTGPGGQKIIFRSELVGGGDIDQAVILQGGRRIQLLKLHVLLMVPSRQILRYLLQFHTYHYSSFRRSLNSYCLAGGASSCLPFLITAV